MTATNHCQWENCGAPCRIKWCSNHASAASAARHQQARAYVKKTGRRPTAICQWENCGAPCRVKWCAQHRSAANRAGRVAAYQRRQDDSNQVEHKRQISRDYMRRKRSTWTAADRRKANETRRLSRYGVNSIWYMATLAAQQGRCAICHATEPGTVRDWHIDHDHITGAPRALLCHHCNLGLGNFKDNPDLLIAAAKYLRHHHQQKLIA